MHASVKPANLPTHTGPDPDWEPDPPDYAFEEAVTCVAMWFEQAGRQNEAPYVADFIDLGIEAFQRLRRERRAGWQFDDTDRAALLTAVASARASARCSLSMEESEDVDDGLRAVQALVAHYAKPVVRRTLPHDRLADLIAHMRLAQNIVRNVKLRHDIERRAERRALSSLDFVEDVS